LIHECSLLGESVKPSSLFLCPSWQRSVASFWRDKYYLGMKGSARYWPILAGPIVTLALSFGWTATSDSFKLLALGIVAGLALALVTLALRNSARKLLSQEFIAAIFFIFGLSAPIIFSNSPHAQQIYGVSGRNLGFLHYLFLLFVLLGISTLDFKFVWPQILKSLVIVGILEAGYGALQFLGLDPVPWKNPDKWIFGTFGNPNYLSSFLALSAIATFYVALVEKRFVYKIYWSALALFQSGIVLLSASSQGLILLSFGVCGFISIVSFNRSRILGISSLISTLLAGLVGVLGIFQIGPLSKYLYQDSVSYRGDYWRAGIRMFKDNWLHGVGLDSYGDYFRMYRDNIAANRRGLDVFSNSAHNIFIDLAATGGIVLLLGYLSLIGIVAFSVARAFKSSSVVSLEYKILVILWVAFNLQTVISINVPSLAIWGWIFSGLILAYENVRNPIKTLQRVQKKGLQKSSVTTSTVCCLFCIALVAPLINRDVKLADALSKNQISEISHALLINPKDADQIAGVAIAYEKLGRSNEALALARSAISENPNSPRAWKIILESREASLLDKDRAKIALLRLDPYFFVK